MSLIWRASKHNLKPGFLADIEKFFAKSSYTWYVLSAYRSLEEQAALYEKYKQGGPKAARPGESAHNYGLAIDVVLDTDPDKPGLQPSWDVKLAGWGWLKSASIPHPRLQCGWSFGDWPHVQRFNWRKYIV